MTNPITPKTRLTMSLSVWVAFTIAVATFGVQGTMWYNGIIQSQVVSDARIMKKIESMQNIQTIININTSNDIKGLRDSVRQLNIRLARIDYYN